MESRLSYEKTSTDFEVKRSRQTTTHETVDYVVIALADRKVAQYTTCTNQSFHSCEHDSHKEMIAAVSKAGPSYVGPTEYTEEWETDKSVYRVVHVSLLFQRSVYTCISSTRARVHWSTARPASYQLVTKFTKVTDADRGGDEDDVDYLVNDELHKCVSSAKDTPNKSYSSEVELVSELQVDKY